MRTTTVRVLAATLLALTFGKAAGQAPPKPAPTQKAAPAEKTPSKLEELIAQALRENPDVRVAEAKLRESEAELNRVRLQAIQKVVSLQNTIEAASAKVDQSQAAYETYVSQLRATEVDHARVQKLAERNTVSAQEVRQAQVKREEAAVFVGQAKAQLQAAKADQAKVQAEMPYLLGRKPAVAATHADSFTPQLTRYLYANQLQLANQAWHLDARERSTTALSLLALEAARNQQPQGTVAERLRKALDKSVGVRLQDTTLADTLKFFQELAGVPLLDHTAQAAVKSQKVTLQLQDVPLGAAFQALGDVADLHFAVREYGVLVSDRPSAQMMPLHAFWKGDTSAKKP